MKKYWPGASANRKVRKLFFNAVPRPKIYFPHLSLIYDSSAIDAFAAVCVAGNTALFKLQVVFPVGGHYQYFIALCRGAQFYNGVRQFLNFKRLVNQDNPENRALAAWSS